MKEIAFLAQQYEVALIPIFLGLLSDSDPRHNFSIKWYTYYLHHAKHPHKYDKLLTTAPQIAVNLVRKTLVNALMFII